MSKRWKVFLSALGAVILLLLVVAISIPNLMRSRIAANEASAVGRLRAAEMEEARSSDLSLNAPAVPEKKLIQNAELVLVVANVRSAAEEIQRLTTASHGEIGKLEIIGTSGETSATIELRVPASGLQNAVTEFKKLALRTEREQISSRDVTREFYDNEAHMRNLRAEEQQYLSILKQAHTIKDTLDASEKLSDVRDRIERLQVQIQVMTHDIDMSLVTIALMQESDTQILGVHWRPLHDAKRAVHDLLAGLGDWVDWVAGLVIKLPLIILWVATVLAILWICWRIARFLWMKFVRPAPAKTP